MTHVYHPLVLEVLAHRYLYYVLMRPVLDDYSYDMLERSAKRAIGSPDDLEELTPDYAVFAVGSENPDDYPKEAIELALKLLNPR